MSDPVNSHVRMFIHRQNKKTPSDSEFGHQHLDLAHLSISQNEMGSDEKTRTEEYMGDRNSLLSLQPWIFRKNFNQVDAETCTAGSRNIFDDGMDNGINFLDPPTSPKNFRFPYTSRRNKNRSSLRNCIRSKRDPIYSATKAVESVENCLIPQLYYGNNFQMEDFAFSSTNASTSSGHFCITDGSQFISKLSCDPPLDGHSVDGLKRERVTLEKFYPDFRKSKRRSESMQFEELSNSCSKGNGKQCNLEGDRLILICLGISIGVFSTLMRNKKEVQQLNDLLKNSQNLVRDLQEELDMKDSLTVNELIDDNLENDCVIDNLSDPHGKVNSCNSESPNLNLTTTDRPHSDKDGKNSEYMDKIEAELEVELEKLQLNMSYSSLEGKLSSLHDEFYLHDGELMGGMFEKRSKEDEDSGSNSSSGHHNLNYAVSPKELTLRLYELNQSRLEDHIMELEAKLDQLQKKLQMKEEEKTERAYSCSSSSIASSSTSPPTLTVVAKNVEDVNIQPLCLNLCDDAPDEYEEAYDEFIRISSLEENPNSGVEQQISNDGEFFELKTGESYPDIGYFDRDDSIWKVGNNDENDLNLTFFDDGGDDDDGNDEEGKILIQQIVDRMRKSSSVALHTQKMLFALDGHH